MLRKARRGRRNGSVDVLLTHAPGTPGAAAVHDDGADPAHRALPAVDMLVDSLRPALHLHGHIHLHGADRRVFSLPSDDEAHAPAGTITADTTADTTASGTAPHAAPEPPPGAQPRTLVVNTVGWTLTRVHPPRTTPRAELILKGR